MRVAWVCLLVSERRFYTSAMRVSALLMAAALALTLTACGGSDDDDPTPATSPTAGASATSGGATAIRQVTLEEVADVQVLLAETGAALDRTTVLYADLTQDGIEEAIVPLTSRGTAGDVAFIVLTPDGDGTKTLLSEKPEASRGLALAVTAGKLIATEPVPGPDDPECCPSMLRETTYGWNGAALAVEGVETVPNPDGGIKGTPATTN
jgi:hypothetical protein